MSAWSDYRKSFSRSSCMDKCSENIWWRQDWKLSFKLIFAKVSYWGDDDVSCLYLWVNLTPLRASYSCPWIKPHTTEKLVCGCTYRVFIRLIFLSVVFIYLPLFTDLVLWNHFHLCAWPLWDWLSLRAVSSLLHGSLRLPLPRLLTEHGRFGPILLAI